MRTVLSSSATPIFQTVLPIVWVGSFALGTSLLFIQRDPDAPMYLAATVLGAAFLVPFASKLVHVEMDEEAVYLSKFRRSITVPLTDIASVDHALFNAKRVCVGFRARTEFGNSVQFISKVSNAEALIRSRAGLYGKLPA